MEERRGFFSELFDFSFAEFLTPKIIKVLYGLGILMAGIVAIGFLASGFKTSTGLGIVTLILSPIVFLLYVIFIRVYLELVIVIFRIADHTETMAGRSSGAPPAASAGEDSSPLV